MRSLPMEPRDADLLVAFWQTVQALPAGAVIATGFEDNGLVFWQKTDDDWVVVRVDDVGVVDTFPVGMPANGDRDLLDCAGNIEVAYVVHETGGDFDVRTVDPAALREADRVAVFCLAGHGHQNVQVDPAEPDTGHAGAIYCEDCGTELRETP